jgi:hypothetical protein
MHKRLLNAITLDLSALADIPAVVCYDEAGKVITRAELEAWFGAPVHVERCQAHPDAPFIARVVSLQCRDTGAVQLVRLVDPGGLPIVRAAIARWWPDAPGLDPYPEDCYASRWRDRSVIGWTNEEGLIGFGMGGGDKPPGYSGVWALHCQAPSDWVGGLGWNPGREHKVIEVTFGLYPVDDQPGPQPPPPEPSDPELHGLLTDLEEIGALALASHAFARGAIALVRRIVEGGE